MEEVRNSYNIFVGKTKRMRQLGRPRRRWERNIGMFLREIGWEGVEWIKMTQDTGHWPTLVDTVMSFCFHERREIS
jgi:hypothetical protein